MSIWGKRDYFKDHFWMIEGGLLDRYNYLIKNGLLQPGASLLRTGSVLLENGSVFGTNVAPRSGAAYLHHGALTNSLLYTTDYTNPVWVKSNCIAIGTMATVTAPATSRIYQLGLTITPGKPYTLCVTPRGVLASQQFSLRATVGLSGLSNFTPSVGEAECLRSTATSNSANIFIYLNPDGDAGAGVVGDYLDFDVRLVQSDYDISPLTLPTSGTPATIDTAASDLSTMHGLTASINDPRVAWLWKILDDGAGVLTYKSHTITPSPTQWQTTGGEMVLIAQSNGAHAFFIDQADGLYKIHDGVNAAVSPAPYVAGVPADIDIVLMGDTMRIDMNGAQGTPSPFGGTLIHGTDTIKFNMHEDITKVTDIYGISN